MQFSDLLREYIGDRTLESVVVECRQRGIEMDRILLGRLRSGDRLPPEDENVVRALADICDRDPEPLVMLALIERKPHVAYRVLLRRAFNLAYQERRLASRGLEILKEVREKLRWSASSRDVEQLLEDHISTFEDELEEGISAWRERGFSHMFRYLELTHAEESGQRMETLPLHDLPAPDESELRHDYAMAAGIPEEALMHLVAGLRKAMKAQEASGLLRGQAEETEV